MTKLFIYKHDPNLEIVHCANCDSELFLNDLYIIFDEDDCDYCPLCDSVIGI